MKNTRKKFQNILTTTSLLKRLNLFCITIIFYLTSVISDKNVGYQWERELHQWLQTTRKHDLIWAKYIIKTFQKVKWTCLKFRAKSSSETGKVQGKETQRKKFNSPLEATFFVCVYIYDRLQNHVHLLNSLTRHRLAQNYCKRHLTKVAHNGKYLEPHYC